MIHRYLPQLKIASLVALVILVVPKVTHAGVISGIVYELVINLFGTLVYLGALILDSGIEYFVIGFGGTFNNTGIGVAVNDTWAIIRDFVNLGFIFGLVYIGIKMILDADNANARRWLANLILAALLVNFSLFATKFVVDFGNRLAIEIATAGLGTDCSDSSGCTSDVSGQLMDRMGLTSFADRQNAADNAAWGYIFGVAIMFMVAAFVFAAGGIMLIIRFAVLSVYLVASPLMFVGWIIPGLPDQMKKYWNDFLAKVFFAPIYFMFLYFSFQVMHGLQQTVGSAKSNFAEPQYGSAFSGTVGQRPTVLGTMAFFILICVLLIGSLKAASKLGKGAADWSQKMAGRATFGVVGRAGRNTIGRGANAIANSERLKNTAATGGFVSRNLARGALASGSYGAAASFDPRGIKTLGINKQLSAGDPAKGGYAGQVKKAKDDALKRVKGFGEVDIDSAEGKEKVESQKIKVKERLEKEKEEKEKEKATKENIKNLSKKSVSELEAEAELVSAAMKTFTDELKGLKAAFALGKNADGTIMSVEDKEKLDNEIKRREARTVDNQSMITDIRDAKEIAKKREEIEKGIKQDEEAAKTARDNGNYAGYQRAQESQKKRQAQLDGLTANLDKNIKNLDSEVKQLDKDLGDEKKLSSLAKGEVKYSRQIAYLKTQQDSVWNKHWTGSRRKGMAGNVVGSVATSALSGAALLGLSEAGAYGATHKEIVKAIEKEYGKDGSKKFKKDSDAAKTKDLAKAIQDLGGDGGGDSKKE